METNKQFSEIVDGLVFIFKVIEYTPEYLRSSGLFESVGIAKTQLYKLVKIDFYNQKYPEQLTDEDKYIIVDTIKRFSPFMEAINQLRDDLKLIMEEK